MKLHKIGALAAVSVLALAACNSGGTASTAPGGSAAAGGQPAACKNKKGTSSTEIHVYSSLPRQGTNTEQTNTLVEQIKPTLDGQKIGNFTIKYTDLDDSSAANNGDWDGAVEQANANKAVADPDAMVYIGTYNSGAAKLSIPILNAACMVMISPANTYPGLTKAVEGVTQPGEPDPYYPGGYRNYARVVATDDVQGAAGAEWAKSQGRPRRRTSSTTRSSTAHGLAKSWALHANKIGIEVVSPNKTSEGFDAKATDYSALAQKIKATGADVDLHRLDHRTEHRQALEGPPGRPARHHDHVRRRRVREVLVRRAPAHPATARSSPSAASDRTQLTGAGKEWFDKYKTDHAGNQPATYTAYGNAAATSPWKPSRRPAPTIGTRSSRPSWRTKDLADRRSATSPSTPMATPSVARSRLTRSRPSWPPAFQLILTVKE